jgi:glycosyltransferase involved in cell wall biosynthesis
MSSYAGVHGVLARVSVPTVYTPSAYSFTMNSKRRVVRLAYLALESAVAAQVDVVGACSLSEGEHARALPTARSVAVIPNGIDELSDGGRPRNELEPPRRPRVVAIGRPLPQRRPEGCARILDAVREYGEVCWLGGGSDDSNGTQALREAGIPMTGWTPRDEMLVSLASSTVYLHWTAWDGLPLSVLEAMSLDVVVVASDIGPNREVLGPDQVCRTEAQAIDLIRRVLSDAALRERLIDGQRARRTLYGADRMVSGWSELYRAISSSASSGPSADGQAGFGRERQHNPARRDGTV